MVPGISVSSFPGFPQCGSNASVSHLTKLCRQKGVGVDRGVTRGHAFKPDGLLFRDCGGQTFVAPEIGDAASQARIACQICQLLSGNFPPKR